MSSTACTDPRAPLPRAFSISFGGGRRKHSFSRGSSSYGRNRYGGYGYGYGGFNEGAFLVGAKIGGFLGALGRK